MAGIGDLPERILQEVLCLLPMEELIRNCRVVCTRWRDLVDSPALWQQKYQQKGNHLETQKVCLDLQKGYFIFSHLEKNLLKNPCGEEGLAFWDIKIPVQGQWKIEELSEADTTKLQKWNYLQRNRCLKKEDIPYQQVNKCFSAHNGLCIKSQLITLKDHGYWDQLIDEAEPHIVVNDWFYHGFGCRYQLWVKLLSADFKVLQEYGTRNAYERDIKTEQWREVSLMIDSTQGLRHILFQHQGQNINPSGDGTRITKSSLTLGPYSFD
ncbi:F-box only protein 44-like [Elgaria multicarinata webbii]|uniref:F-box only protein 44-like n=1 Tax=Elgaria multicarinata webbii TaxID=159646 RepID=UPI002FCD4BF6